jgi:hypothetical protein
MLKYHSCDGDGPYRDIELRRVDVIALWPRHVGIDIDSIELGTITGAHLEPMTGQETYVPLSVALCWGMTSGGAKDVALRDKAAWEGAVKELMPQVSGGSIEIIGQDIENISKPLPCTAFDSVAVPHPLNIVDVLFEAPTHIQCDFYTDDDSWKGDGGDKFFAAGSARPKWKLLKVRRANVLTLWPKPTRNEMAPLECEHWLSEKMIESPARQPKSKTAFFKEARQKFRGLSRRQFEMAWDAAIKKTKSAQWSKPGRLRKKSNHPAE